jgi:DnaK suppressor protein
MGSHDAVRATLRLRLDQLTKRVGAIESDLRRAGDRDSEEQAVERENDQVLEGLDATSRGEAEQILAALGRIRNGQYGTCVKCGGAIPAARLVAIPTAATCVTCVAR